MDPQLLSSGLHHFGTGPDDDDTDLNPEPSLLGKHDRNVRSTTVTATQFYGDANEEPLVHITFADSKKKRKTGEAQCWGCAYGHLVEDQEKHPAAFGLWKLFAQKYGKVDNAELFEMMHQYHEYYIRKPAMEDNEDCLPWDVDVIAEHVLNHMTDPVIELGESIRDQRHIRSTLKDDLYEENPETGERPSHTDPLPLPLAVK